MLGWKQYEHTSQIKVKDNFDKLINHTEFGKTVENVRKHRVLKLSYYKISKRTKFSYYKIFHRKYISNWQGRNSNTCEYTSLFRTFNTRI